LNQARAFLLRTSKEKEKANTFIFFVLIQRSKNHTRSVFYEKTKNGEKHLFLSFFSLMKRSKNQPTEHNLLKISH